MTILLLGGTTEASRLATRLAAERWPAILSYAGRVAAPKAQPLPTRSGGFGGAEGLARYLRDHRIRALIDATHPFAATMSGNAIRAAAATGTPLLAFQRPAWAAEPEDRWTHVPDLSAAAAALPPAPERVFLAIGRQGLAAFAGLPHRFLLRLVDPPEALPFPADVVIARGPFDAEGDLALLRAHGIQRIVAKNAGGAGAEAKLIAARALGLPVILIDRPPAPPRAEAATVTEVMAWLHATLRGV